MNSPTTLPSKIENFPPTFPPSNWRGGARVNAAMRCGSVKVMYNSSAVVRNSSDAVNVVTLTATFLSDVVVVVVAVAGVSFLA